MYFSSLHTIFIFINYSQYIITAQPSRRPITPSVGLQNFLHVAPGTPALSAEGPCCFNTSLCHTQLFSSKTTLHGRSKLGQSGMHTQTRALAALTHSSHDNTSIISAAHSQVHIRAHWLQLHRPLALIKGRNVIDREEIREGERRWLSHFSNQAAVCGKSCR